MFNFTTQTVLNSVVVANATSSVKGANVITSDDNNPTVRIGNIRFKPEDVLDILKKLYQAESITSVTFDMAKVVSALENEPDGTSFTFRIALYVGLTGSDHDAFYANSLTYFGKPFYVEFLAKKGETASVIAKRVVKNANKYFSFATNVPIMTVSVDSDTKVKFEGVEQYQNIKKAALLKFDPNAEPIDCCINKGAFVDIIVGVPLMWKITDGEVSIETTTFEDGEGRSLNDDEVGITPGLDAFCDYNWIIRNLRIPTHANTAFFSVTKDEMPIIGGKYNQYVIRLCKDRDGIVGEIVGARVTSVTNHVFYVNQDYADVFEAELLKLFEDGKTFLTDADDRFEDPFNPNPESNSGSNSNDNSGNNSGNNSGEGGNG